MHDMTVRSAAFRALVSGGARGTVSSIRSSHLMQEMVGTFFTNEKRNNVEHFEPFGFTSAIVSKTADGIAEAAMSFLSGAKNHAIASVISDRRFRLRGLMQGETAQHDDLGQATLLRRIGTFIVSFNGKGNSNDNVPGSNNNNRMVSIRHIKKDKPQPKPQANPNQFGSQGYNQIQDQNQQQAENYKHEGEDQDVNMEIRVTGTRIEFRDGTKVVGFYDKEQGTWQFDSKNHYINVDEKQRIVAQQTILHKARAGTITHDAPNILGYSNTGGGGSYNDGLT
jgi:phage gp45-like